MRNFLSVAVLLTALAGCAKPEGFRQINNDGRTEPLSAEAIRRAAAKLPKTMQVISVGKAAERLGRVSERVAKQVPGDQDWTFLLIADDKVSVWTLPPRTIVLSNGLVTRLGDEELAGLIGNQLAHIHLGHQERLFERVEVEVASIVPERGLETSVSDEELYMDAVSDVLSDLASNGFQSMPYDEKMELEADHLGAYYMARAGYDPRALLSLWSKFEAWESEDQPDLIVLSVHKGKKRRLSRLQARMNDYLLAYADMRHLAGRKLKKKSSGGIFE